MANTTHTNNQLERRTFQVVIITAIVMVLEIVAGYWTSSMALTADGWHMASHTGALLVSWFAYRATRVPKFQRFRQNQIIALGGYTSALFLGFIGIGMLIESGRHLLTAERIHFDEAIAISILGLITNLVCAWLLGHQHTHHHEHGEHSSNAHHHHDHHLPDSNIKGAYAHVLADALTSILAIVSLVLGKHFGLLWLDAAVGIVGALVVLRWSFGLIKTSSLELLSP